MVVTKTVIRTIFDFLSEEVLSAYSRAGCLTKSFTASILSNRHRA